MKKLITFIAALCIALPAVAAPKKDDKGKDRYAKKEAPPQTWSVVVEGASSETAAEEVKAFLSGMKGVKVETIEKKENTVEAVISSKEKLSRSDVSKAIKENKELKVKEFKVKRPDKDADKKGSEKTGEPKKDAPKKEGDKTEPKKDGDKTEPKKDGDKTEPKKDGDKTEPKKD